MTHEEALKLAESLVDYRANMVADAIRLARYVIDGGDANELLRERDRVDCLKAGIARLAAAATDERDGIIAELVVACAGMR